jgi:molybdate transport system substrate-binding protein
MVASVTAPRLRLLTVLLGASLVFAGACGDDQADAGGDGLRGTLDVFAASSLTEAFSAIEQDFEDLYAGAKLTFNFASSSELATQIIEGAPADVFASADPANIDKVAAVGLVDGDADVFAKNDLTIVVEPGNPLGIEGLADLARDDVTVVLCDETVPCGKYAKQALDGAGVTVEPASFEDKVKGVVTKVTLGEADAGIAYVSDAVGAGDDVDAVGIPEEQNVVASYPIAVLSDSDDEELAQAFTDYVQSAEGQATLRQFGFLAP